MAIKTDMSKHTIN